MAASKNTGGFTSTGLLAEEVMLAIPSLTNSDAIEIGQIARAWFDVVHPKGIHLKRLHEKDPMPLRILTLPAIFRPSTNIVYPPFKHGRYLEEYAYDYLTEHQDTIQTEYVYLPIFWTNLQTHVAFPKQKDGLAILLKKALG